MCWVEIFTIQLNQKEGNRAEFWNHVPAMLKIFKVWLKDCVTFGFHLGCKKLETASFPLLTTAKANQRTEDTRQSANSNFLVSIKN